MALYLRVLGASPFRHGTRVQSSGNPCSRSHSRGVSLRTPHSPATRVPRPEDLAPAAAVIWVASSVGAARSSEPWPDAGNTLYATAFLPDA